MADLTYMVAVGLDMDGNIVRQATTLVDADTDLAQEHLKLADILVYKSDHAICDIKTAVMVSTGYGDEKLADGKDKYRVHRLADLATPERSQEDS